MHSFFCFWTEWCFAPVHRFSGSSYHIIFETVPRCQANLLSMRQMQTVTMIIS